MGKTIKNRLLMETLNTIGGLCIIDKKCKVVFMNEIYKKKMKINEHEVEGKDLREIVQDTRMPLVLDTGHSENAVIYSREGNSLIVNRFPLIIDGEVEGVAGINISPYTEIEKLCEQISELHGLLEYYKNKIKRSECSNSGIESIITQNRDMINLKILVKRIANTKSTILITGESGTGKELFANSVHQLSKRYNMPFVKVNCAAIPENLLESELFGYAEGSFTGSLKGGKKGDFESANHGTLLLDEIDALPINLQSKLLRVIQEKELKKIGETETKELDVRFIFTSNKDLMSLVKEGVFREDLFYRINVVDINIPPLRKRKDDIELLVNFFIKKINKELGIEIKGISSEAMDRLKKYDWPGNIRELENAIERACNYATEEILSWSLFDLRNIEPEEDEIEIKKDISSLKNVKDEAEKRHITFILQETKGNKKRCAEILDIDRSVLYAKIKKYNINF